MTLEITSASGTLTRVGPVLDARDLACAIGRRTILRGVNLQVHSGEVLGLIGANGTGKSTLLRTLVGVRRPASGCVLLDRSPLHELRGPERARRIAYVAQDGGEQSDLLVGELVALGRLPHGRAWGGLDEASRTTVRDALDQVGLGYAINQPLDRLSGGERRRALIARGLAQEAPVLVLDEPTNHLDIGHQLALMRRIRSLARDADRTVIVALHDLDLAATFCDRIAVLHEGGLLASGPPAQVLTPQLLHDAFGVLGTRVTHPLTGRTHLLFSHDEREDHP